MREDILLASVALIIKGPKRISGVVVAALLALLISMSPVNAQGTEGEWEFVLAPYVLFASMEGSTSIGRVGGTFDAKFKDIVKSLKVGGMLHAEARRDQFGVMTDLVYARLGADIDVALGSVLDAGVEQIIWEAFLFGRRPLQSGFVDFYGGIRYWDLDIDVSLEGGLIAIDAGRHQAWTDPVIGLRLVHDLGQDLALTLRGDIGGFGLASDFTFNVQAGVAWEVSDTFTLALQYKYLDADYDKGTPGTPDFFAIDIATHGPLLGFVFTL